ncbi:DUF7847 domain-containing protein [Haloarcula laminariae]|uniref:DUF7847 domain-containing protein n=1 Tax=Haloarcula laminariae TaxID=2961577 RepID=UPI002404B168|nr:hypothetical protein [Halomicroarcula sp. FL173]
MAVFESFRDGWTALRTTPGLLLAGGLLVALSLVGALDLGTAEPGADLAVALALPFALGGFLATAATAVRGGECSLRSFLRAGAANYLRLVGAAVLFVLGVGLVMAVSTAVGFVPVVLVAVAGFTEVAALSAGLGAAMSFVATLVVLAAALLFLQFSAPAIVAEDRGVVDAFRRSGGLVRRNLGGTVGFTLLWALAVEFVPMLGPLLDLGGVGLPVAFPATVAVVGIVSVVGLTYCYTVYVAYFLRLTGALPARDRAAGRVDPDSPVGTQ